jgi:hypothetical protein
VNDEIPPVETVFVIIFSDGSGSSQIFNSMVVSLGNLVESAVINQGIEIEIQITPCATFLRQPSPRFLSAV